MLLIFCISDKEDLDENFCAYYDEDDCRFAYIYKYDEKGKVVIIAQQERECPEQVYVLGKILQINSGFS